MLRDEVVFLIESVLAYVPCFDPKVPALIVRIASVMPSEVSALNRLQSGGPVRVNLDIIVGKVINGKLNMGTNA